MKKLLMWSALLMTGFAFYSCDDVIDNPVQDDSAVWNYSVTVKFADFDFKGMGDATGPYKYEAPKTLYVFNEELEPLGTIATNTPPSAGGSAKYEGKLRGAIGNNLIITTKTGVDYAKQDGTIESIIENAIVQSAKVAVRLYSNYNYNLATYDANMENNIAIAHLDMGWLAEGDEVTITSDNIANEDKSLAITVAEGVNTWDLYVAIPTDAEKDFDYAISVNAVNGEVKGAELKDIQLEKGEINNPNPATNEPWHIGEKVLGVDLTKWDAFMRKDKNNAWYMNMINNGNVPSYDHGEGIDYSFIITQSGEKTLDSLNVNIMGDKDKKVSLTLNNVRLGKDSYFGINNGATFDITLIGENKFEKLNLNSPFTKKGTGTWEFNQLNVGGGSHFDNKGEMVVDYATEYTIAEDLDLAHISVYNGGEITIADGKTVNITCDIENELPISIWCGTLNIGKASKLNAQGTIKDKPVIEVIGFMNIGEGAEVNVKGAKNNTALAITDRAEDWSVVDWVNVTEPAIRGIKSKVNIGKNAKVNLTGGPSNDSFGTGININAQITTVDLNILEGAIVNATSVSRTALRCGAKDDDNDNTLYAPVININIAKDAKIIAEDIEDGSGITVEAIDGAVNFDGAGTLEAKSNSNYAMEIRGGKGINFKGGKFLAIGGKDKPAIYGNPFTIGEKIISFKAQKGADATQYISNWGAEAELDALVTDKTKFTDTTKDGVRTITPKAE